MMVRLPMRHSSSFSGTITATSRLYIFSAAETYRVYMRVWPYSVRSELKRRSHMNNHYDRSRKADESVGQQIIFEFGICFATLLAIGIACELVFRAS
jgi:hypothetical protein